MHAPQVGSRRCVPLSPLLIFCQSGNLVADWLHPPNQNRRGGGGRGEGGKRVGIMYDALLSGRMRFCITCLENEVILSSKNMTFKAVDQGRWRNIIIKCVRANFPESHPWDECRFIGLTSTRWSRHGARNRQESRGREGSEVFELSTTWRTHVAHELWLSSSSSSSVTFKRCGFYKINILYIQ